MDGYDVVIVGGGYAGVMCALRLAGKMRRRGARIALINPRRNFVERLRLHENLVVDHQSPMRSFDIGEFLAPAGVRFILAEVDEVDRSVRQLVLKDGQTQRRVGYRHLVIAAGSHSRLDTIPGQAEFTYRTNLDDPRGVAALRDAVRADAASRFVIVGGGATGIEIAAELAMREGACVSLMQAGPLAGFAVPGVRRQVGKALARLGVRIIEGEMVDRIDADAAIVGNSSHKFDVCVAATGFQTPAFVRGMGLPIDAGGRLLTDPALRSIGDHSVFAAGDAALPTEPCGAPARMSVLYALASGAHVGDALADQLAGRTRLRRFGFWTYGQAIGLGPGAVGYSTIPHDRALRPYFTGRTAYGLRNFFVSILFDLLKLERKMPGFPFYMGRPLRRTEPVFSGP